MPLSMWEISTQFFFFLLHYHSPLFSVKLISFCLCQKSFLSNGFSACRFSIYDKGMLLVFFFFTETQQNVDVHTHRIPFLSLRLLILVISNFISWVLQKTQIQTKVMQRSTAKHLANGKEGNHLAVCSRTQCCKQC